MDNAFQIPNLASARKYLASFDATTRKRGEAYWRQGAVDSIIQSPEGGSFHAIVRGGEHYQVGLYHDDNVRWDAECSCPVGIDCKHIYAAMLELIRLGEAMDAGGGPADRNRKPGALNELAAALEQATGKPVPPAALRLTKQLATLFQRVRAGGGITHFDLADLSLRVPGYSWAAIKPWPETPETLPEFWLYLVNYLRSQQVAPPAFMQPVSDTAPIEPALARWRRQLEIERWRQWLHQRPGGGMGLMAAPQRFDFRLRWEPTEAALEVCESGGGEFRPVKQNRFRELAHAFEAASVEIEPAAELLWHAFLRRSYSGFGPRVRYTDPDAVQLLGRLLRLASLRSRMVTADGLPMPVLPNALRWELNPPGPSGADYEMRLTTATGGPLPPVHLTMPGRPTLFLAGDQVLEGPPINAQLFNPARETVIPAEVVESGPGVQLLHELQAPLPGHLARRVRHEKVRVRLSCAINAQYSTETCFISVTATGADGQVAFRWEGNHWMEARDLTKPAANTAGAAPGDAIVLLDRGPLQLMPALLSGLAPKYDYQSERHYARVTRNFPAQFTQWLAGLPKEVEVLLGGELKSLVEQPASGKVSFVAEESQTDWFDIQIVLDVSDTELTPEEIKLLLDAKGNWVRLKGKGWRRLEFNLSEEENQSLARLGLAPGKMTSEPQRLHALQLADPAARKFLPDEQAEQIQRRAGEIQARVTPEIPAAIQGELRPYQREGFHFLAYLATNRFGGILADDMGLGKTLQTLAWLAWLRARETKPAPVLVVCPKSVMDNWRAEAERFLPSLKVRVWSAGELTEFIGAAADHDLHVINYNQLRILGESLAPVTFLAVILDEAQYIKNPSSQIAQIARALRAEHRLVLTGTPIENRLLDLWSLMAFAMPGALGSRNQFGKLYNAKDDPLARLRLSSRVRPFLLRRTKSQVAKDLPERIEEDLFCEIEGEQQTLYRAELKRAQQLLLKVRTQKQLAEQRMNFLTSLLRLRQICCHAKLVRPQSGAPSAKVEALLDQLEPIVEEGNKVLVFSQFVELLDLLAPEIEARGWPVFQLTGQTENRGDLVREFQGRDGGGVFLISLKAGGFGLNLTAASYVVLFDPWWNPAVENQAIDRTHRIGQTRNVIAYRLLIKNSIEEKIRALQRRKKALAEDVLGEEKFSQSLSLDDLQFLFAD